MDDILLRAPATLSLLVANVVLSFAAFNNARLVDRLLFDMNRIRRFNEWYRMFTSGFIHGDPFHLLMNMLALYFMGPYLELTTGTTGFLVIYVASLFAGSMWTYMEHYRDPNYRALGASGAVSGITTAAAVFYPFTQILLFFALPMPLGLFAIAYIAFSWGRRGRACATASAMLPTLAARLWASPSSACSGPRRRSGPGKSSWRPCPRAFERSNPVRNAPSASA